MKTDNQYLKGIAENTGSNVNGHHSDNYYLKRIENNTKGGNTGGAISSEDLTDVTVLPVVITYMDDSTEVKNILIQE